MTRNVDHIQQRGEMNFLEAGKREYRENIYLASSFKFVEPGITNNAYARDPRDLWTSASWLPVCRWHTDNYSSNNSDSQKRYLGRYVNASRQWQLVDQTSSSFQPRASDM
jgi:hypothetical protein